MGAVDYVVIDALFDYMVPSSLQQPRNEGMPFITRSRLGPGHPESVRGGVLYDGIAIRAALHHRK
jgi:hypothetical protein